MPATERHFVSTRARRRGVAALLLDRANRTGAGCEQTPALGTESAARITIGLYERPATSTADRTTADGRLARMRAYVAPAAPPLNSSCSNIS
ncbi:hypothetical protein [Streptomyces sp. bgisy031]|uniref:hypothetical protein n=1 Tax=Streptomyces sp. bgisy031 TaxID=3413772 RepID=UPI003D738603